MTLQTTSERFGAELEAASPHAVVRQFLEDAGRISVAAARLEAVQDRVSVAQSNLHLVQGVAEILPPIDCSFQFDPNRPDDRGAFVVEKGENQLLVARTILANVVWWPRGVCEQPYPHYVVGESEDLQRPGYSNLMLLPAKGDPEGDMPMLKAPIRDDEAKAYRRLTDGYATQDYTEAIAELVDPVSGNIIISPWTPGSIKSFRLKAPRHTSPERIAKDGAVHLSDGTIYNLRNGISNEDLEAFEVDNTVAKLVIAFGLEDKYRALLNPELPEVIDDAERVRRLSKRCAELEGMVAKMLGASGLMTEEEIAEKLAQGRPKL